MYEKELWFWGKLQPIILRKKVCILATSSMCKSYNGIQYGTNLKQSGILMHGFGWKKAM